VDLLDDTEGAPARVAGHGISRGRSLSGWSEGGPDDQTHLRVSEVARYSRGRRRLRAARDVDVTGGVFGRVGACTLDERAEMGGCIPVDSDEIFVRRVRFASDRVASQILGLMWISYQVGTGMW